MKITAIVSAYQTQDYIIEALESLRGCDEILVGVDGCTKTMQAIKHLNWPNLHKFMFQKCTTYKIRNTLAQKATNDMLLFFDSDDIMQRLDLLQSVDADVVRFKFNNFKTDKTDINKSTYCAPGCFMVKRSVFMYYNGFQGWPCSADTEFMYRVDSRHKVAKIDEPVFMRRLHCNALTRNHEYGLRTRARAQINRNLYKRVKFPILDNLATATCKQLT